MDDVNPQAENGHIDVANEIAEALARCMPGGLEGCIIWAILRKTYGWHKKSDKISLSQLIKMTCRSKRAVIYAVQNLEAKKFIIVDRTGAINEYQFNKHHNQWLVQKFAPQVKKNRDASLKRYHATGAKVCTGAKVGNDWCKSDEKDVQTFAHTKETNTTKETIQKKESRKFSDYSLEVQSLVKDLIAGIASCYSQFKDRYENDTTRLDTLCRSWAVEIDKLIRLDKAKPEDIEAIINWLYKSEGRNALFWRKNILSAAKLKKQYDTLVAAAQNERQVNRVVIIS